MKTSSRLVAVSAFTRHLAVLAFIATCAYPQSTLPAGRPASVTGGAPADMQGGILVTAEDVAEMLRSHARVQIFQSDTPCDDNTTPGCETPGSSPTIGSAIPGVDPACPAGAIQPPPPNQSPGPTASFEAHLDQPSGSRPLDPQLAVSDTHVLVTFNTKFSWYAKSSMKQGELYASELFQPMIDTLSNHLATPCDPNSTTRYCVQDDMRALFDPYRKRFWVLIGAGIYKPDQPVRGIFLLAVSLTEDPKDGWYEYWWDVVAEWGNVTGGVYQSLDVADYPIIGIDAFGFHQTNKVHNCVQSMGKCELFNGSSKDVYRYWAVRVFRASKPVQGIPADGWQFWDLEYPDATFPVGLVQPVAHHGALPHNTAFYVAREGQSTAVVFRLTDPLTPQQQITGAQIAIDPLTYPVNAPQLDSSTQIYTTNLANDVLKASYRSPSLYITMNDAVNWFNEFDAKGNPLNITSIRLIRLDVSGYPQLVKTIDRTFGKNGPGDGTLAHVHYAWPALEVNGAGDIAIGYARSGACIYPEMRYSVFYANEADIRPSFPLKPGEAPALGPPKGVERWGDLGGAQVEPKDDAGIWMAQQYAESNGQSGIWVGKVFGSRYVDFAVGPVSPDPPIAAAGQEISLRGAIRNDGDAPASGGTFAIYLTSQQTRRVLLGEFPIGPLAPGEEIAVRERVTIPSVTQAGVYQLALVIDPKGVVDEYSKDNNTAYGDVRIVAR